ncbi:MAG TPA: hypothetical protein VI542_35705 [Candidatus Tectomicrobia bacterium]
MWRWPRCCSKLRVPLLSPVPQHTLDARGLTTLWHALDPARVCETPP